MLPNKSLEKTQTDVIRDNHQGAGKKSAYQNKSAGFGVEWNRTDENTEFDSDSGGWNPETGSSGEKVADSPSTWDPEEFDHQRNRMGEAWKDKHEEPSRVQDLPTPAVTEDMSSKGQQQRKFTSSSECGSEDEEDQWPFKKPCAFQERNRKRLSSLSTTASLSSSHSKISASVATTSTTEYSTGWAPSSGRTNGINPADSADSNGQEEELDDDIDEGEEEERDRAAQAKWKSRPVTNARRSRKAEAATSLPRGSRPDADDDGVDIPLSSRSKSDIRLNDFKCLFMGKGEITSI